MPLERQYESLTANTASTFYATYQGHLYRIDPASETETRIDASAQVSIHKVAMAGSILLGLGDINHDPALLNLTDGQASEMPHGLTNRNLGPVVLVRAPDVSVGTDSFD